MSLIKRWLAGAVRELDEAAEGRLRQATDCPDCHHGVAMRAEDREEQAAGCRCENEDCGCAS